MPYYIIIQFFKNDDYYVSCFYYYIKMEKMNVSNYLLLVIKINERFPNISIIIYCNISSLSRSNAYISNVAYRISLIILFNYYD